MKWKTGLACIALVWGGCGRPSDSVGSRTDDSRAAECPYAATSPPTADETPSTIEFREVVRLAGDLDGTAPRDPVSALEDGRYLSATWSPGEIALWASDGRLLRVMGEGSGEGPGEFNHPSGFAQTTDDEFIVFSGHAVLHSYSLAGRFRRSLRLPGVGGALRGVRYGDALITEAPASRHIQTFVLENDSVRPWSVRTPREARLFLAAARSDGVWSATSDRHVLRRHRWPDGAIVDSIVGNPDWHPGEPGHNLYGLHADQRGLIWAMMGVGDPDAPDGPMPLPRDAEEQYAITARYLDNVIEAFSPEGSLVASARFDGWREGPMPIGESLWRRVTDDLIPAIVVMEARLVARR